MILILGADTFTLPESVCALLACASPVELRFFFLHVFGAAGISHGQYKVVAFWAPPFVRVFVPVALNYTPGATQLIRCLFF